MTEFFNKYKHLFDENLSEKNFGHQDKNQLRNLFTDGNEVKFTMF